MMISRRRRGTPSHQTGEIPIYEGMNEIFNSHLIASKYLRPVHVLFREANGIN